MHRKAAPAYKGIVNWAALLDWRQRWRMRSFRFLVVFATYGMVACGGGGGCGGGCIDLGGGCGGGCSSCSSCEGCALQPLPAGYPSEERIDNATQVRLTEPGLRFLETAIEPLLNEALPDGLTVPVPRTEFSIAGTDYTVCPDEDCFIRAEIAGFSLDPQDPNRIVADVQVRADARGPDGNPRILPLRVKSPLIPAYICDVTFDTRRGDNDAIALRAPVVLSEETRAPRAGYTRIDVSGAAFADGRGPERDDFRVSGCILGPLFNSVRPILIREVEAQIGDIIAGSAQPCTAPVDGACPGDTFARGDTCRFEDNDDADCVPMPLGVEGRLDLGALLGAFSPGTGGGIQLLLAAQEDAEADDGLNLRMYGGLRSEGHDICVPEMDPPTFDPIPVFSAVRTNDTPDRSSETHVNIAIAETFLDQAGYGMWDSGGLCLGVGTSLAQQLSTGLFSLVAPNLRTLTFPDGSSPIAIALRPQAPPDFTVGSGDDPLLQVLMPSLEMDFYVFSSERYVRFMTFSADLLIDLGLDVEDGAIVPRIGEIQAMNPVATNAEILDQDPEALAGSIAGILEGAASMFAGAIPAISLPDFAGLSLNLPPGGITGIEEGDERALAIFATLATAGPEAFSAPVETRLEIDFDATPEHFQLTNWHPDGGPVLTAHVDAEGPLNVEFEYALRIDGMPWSAWQSSGDFVVQGGVLRYEGKHHIEARARVAGEFLSVDESPAATDLLIDFQAPELRLEQREGGVAVVADDIVSDNLELRFARNGVFTEWVPAEELGLIEGEEAGLEVEARDEAGNIGRIGSQQQSLIRGRPNPIAGGGCDCRSTGGSNTPWVLFGALGWLFFRRRRETFGNR